MKKFYASMTLQMELEQYVYKAMDNSCLHTEFPTAFPVIAAINGYVRPGECFAIVTLCADNEITKRNYQTFCNEVKELCEKKGLLFPELHEVIVPDDESVSVQLDTFQKLIGYAADEDEVFACMTYGTKPMSEVMLTAIDYSCRICKDTQLRCVVYGKVVRGPKPWHGEIYDMTALFRMDDIINKLSMSKVKNPAEVIKTILKL